MGVVRGLYWGYLGFVLGSYRGVLRCRVQGLRAFGWMVDFTGMRDLSLMCRARSLGT